MVNNSGSTYTGSFTLTGNDIFGLDGDGICTCISGTPAGSYCSTAASDYYGPLSTFSIMNSNSGMVTITGLASGQGTFFFLEGAPIDLNITVGPGTPEPATWALLGGGLCLLSVFGRRRLKRS